MASHELDKASCAKARQIVSRLAQELARRDQGARSDPARAYTLALGSFVDQLLSTWHSVEPAPDNAFPEWIDQSELAGGSTPTPEIVGRLYEYLRGFRLELRPGQRPVLVPSAKGKRNQGLFYTPQLIVRHIVRRALDALEIRDPDDYLKARIVDPAMGTGAFLAEALEQLTWRVTTGNSRRGGQPCHNGVHPPCPCRPSESVICSEEQTALRARILENNLYGVDVDPIAVRIARAVLRERVFTAPAAAPDMSTHLRVGNALIGTVRGESRLRDKDTGDDAHFRAYFGHGPQEKGAVAVWVESKKVFHWPIEFPDVFAREDGGFDAVVGNPPYEIVSVKESGIEERHREQAYFRKNYRTCRGKINTYRLMMERAMDLLRKGGVLGFIVPATFMADSTAERLRKMILDGSRIVETVLIPEKARVFDRVTQALVILITRKGSETRTMRPILWNGSGPIPDKGPGEIDRRLLTYTGSRIPLLRDEADKKLLEALTRHPRFGGNGVSPAVGTVHQGEINLTVHRQYITDGRTDFPLIRGEHVMPLQIVHPCQGAKRLDWVLGAFIKGGARDDTRGLQNDRGPRGGSRQSLERGTPWEKERIVLARVVNMGTDRRLKAALAPAGTFLGDMTNFIADPSATPGYLLGLLNSRMLNWRFKLTSANNYISAKEIEDLPIPRLCKEEPGGEVERDARSWLGQVRQGPGRTIEEYLASLRGIRGSGSDLRAARRIGRMIEWTVETIRGDVLSSKAATTTTLWNLLDALVLMHYEVERYVRVIER